MSTVLDDLKMIHSRDAQDALGVAQKQYTQLKHKYQVDLGSINRDSINNIVLGGMGGSALAALMLTSWPKPNLPFEIVRNYDTPEYADENTLFIASSYSGKTEETLEALRQAQAKGCQIIVIAAGGKLAEIAAEKSYPFFQIPEGYQPRMAVFYNFAALVNLYDFLFDTKKTEELNQAADWLGSQADGLSPDVPTVDNQAKQIALDIVGSSLVIYSGPVLSPAAYKWKINFNENSKNIAWTNTLPEFNHNEFLGWTSHPAEKPYKVIDLRSSFDNQRIKKRFEISSKLLSGMRPHPMSVEAVGQSQIEQLLWTIQLGDFVSLYLALLNGLNPTPVDLIEKLKLALND